MEPATTAPYGFVVRLRGTASERNSMRRSVFAWGRHLAGSAPTRGWQDERSRPCPGTLRHSCSQVLTFSCCVGLRVPYCSTPCTMALWVFIVAIKDLTFGCPSAQDVFGYHDELSIIGALIVSPFLISFFIAMRPGEVTCSASAAHMHTTPSEVLARGGAPDGPKWGVQYFCF